jgi:hypothetical protein
MPANRATRDGCEYGPTVHGKKYLSLFYHRDKRSIEKNIWHIKPDDEYDVFLNSDKHHMYDDSNQDYWGVLEKGKTKIGTRGQRISKFERPKNLMDPWHGYPIFPAEEKKRNALPSDFDDLIAKWMKSNLIAKELGKKLLKERN